MVAERPPVLKSGKRAKFIAAIEEAKAAAAAKKQEWTKSAWHMVPEDVPFKKEAQVQQPGMSDC